MLTALEIFAEFPPHVPALCLGPSMSPELVCVSPDSWVEPGCGEQADGPLPGSLAQTEEHFPAFHTASMCRRALRASQLQPVDPESRWGPSCSTAGCHSFLGLHNHHVFFKNLMWVWIFIIYNHNPPITVLNVCRDEWTSHVRVILPSCGHLV